MPHTKSEMLDSEIASVDIGQSCKNMNLYPERENINTFWVELCLLQILHQPERLSFIGWRSA